MSSGMRDSYAGRMFAEGKGNAPSEHDEREEPVAYSRPTTSWADDLRLSEAVKAMRALGYDAETLNMLSDHMLGGEAITPPEQAEGGTSLPVRFIDCDHVGACCCGHSEYFANNVGLAVTCRVFDDWQDIYDEWSQSAAKEGFFWWGRAFGAFLRRHLDARPHPSAPLLEALKQIAKFGPEEEPEYDHWGGDTDRAESWGYEQAAWDAACIARAAIERHEGGEHG